MGYASWAEYGHWGGVLGRAWKCISKEKQSYTWVRMAECGKLGFEGDRYIETGLMWVVETLLSGDGEEGGYHAVIWAI